MGIGDSRVSNAFAVEPQKVGVVRHEDPTGRRSDREFPSIVGACKASQPIRDGDAIAHVLIEVESDRQQLRCFFEALLS